MTPAISSIHRTGFMHLIWASLVTVLLGPAVVTAVVVDSGDGSGNTAAPEDDPGFANVGTRGVATAIYLGNRWAMTAAHVRAGKVQFGETVLGIVPDETMRLTNPEDLSDETDILLFRLDEVPELPSLRLPCEPRRLGGELVMVGHGHDRESEPTFWSVDVGPKPNDDVWTEVASEAESDRQGFKTVASQSIRWGSGATNTTELISDTDYGDVMAFTSSFSKQFELESLGQAVRGDSGGAVFEKNLGVWELVGLIFAVDPLENQPSTTRTAVYGERTLIADLFRYKDAILEIADFEPEPVDLNGDGIISANEIDGLMAAQEQADFASCHYDVDRNGTVNSLDVEAFFDSAQILAGDANLDGTVGFADFLTLSRTFGSNSKGWAEGDFDGDGLVSFADFLKLSSNFGESVELVQQRNGIARVSPVPESSLPLLPLLILIGLAHRRLFLPVRCGRFDVPSFSTMRVNQYVRRV